MVSICYIVIVVTITQNCAINYVQLTPKKTIEGTTVGL